MKTRILTDAGIENRQAEAMVEMTHKTISENAPATGEVAELKVEIGNLGNKIDKVGNKIDKMGTELTAEIGKVENLVNERCNKIDAALIELGQEIADLERRILGGHLWFVSSALTVAGMILGAAITLYVMGN